MVDRTTERSEAGRNLLESGTLGGAQSFGVTESATVSPKVCAPGGYLIFPGGVGFEIRSVSGGCGAVLVANLTRPVMHGVSVRVIGIRLGLQFSKPHDKHVNASGEPDKPVSVKVIKTA